MLSKEVFLKSVVLPYSEEYDWNVKAGLQDYIPDLVFDENRDYYMSLSQAKLMVFEYDSTTMLEALVMDKPFIVRDGGCFCMEREAVGDYESLKSVEVMYDTFEEMLYAIDAIYADVDTWWNDLVRKKVINQFRKKYAYFPENAEQVWIKEIMSCVK